jgi:hypothetical protein
LAEKKYGVDEMHAISHILLDACRINAYRGMKGKNGLEYRMMEIARSLPNLNEYDAGADMALLTVMKAMYHDNLRFTIDRLEKLYTKK